MPGRPLLVVFLGDLEGSDSERLVSGARVAAAFDTIETALGTGAFDGALVATDTPDLASIPAGAAIDVDEGPFRFGERLADIAERSGANAILYVGGGAVPLLPGDAMASMAAHACAGSATTNNLYSSDVAAFPVTSVAVEAIRPLRRDNGLGRALADAGMAIEALPRTAETLFDIDTPADVAVLATTGRGGRRVREYACQSGVDTARYERVLPLFMDTRSQIAVAGRVGSHAWTYLERETACRVRLFAEERGMEADARVEARRVRSLLGYYYADAGSERFFATLRELADAWFIDTRVLLAHAGIEAARADRFASDLGRWEDVSDPWLREFTRGALQCEAPVLLGGHSLMSGGLMALNEHAWSLRDAGKL